MHPRLRMAFLPPSASDTLLSEAVLVSYANSSHRPGVAVMIRIGQLETFEDQPLSLTLPVRGLVVAWYYPDLVINHTIGRNGSSASLEVPVSLT